MRQPHPDREPGGGALSPSARDRARGALLGLAAGDALGTTIEFCAPGTFAPLTDIVGGGPFGLEPGQWTDDTSMAICLAESLLATQTHNPRDQLERYLRWYRKGENSSTGTCFDIGSATVRALTRFERRRADAYPGDAAPDAAGNGPLMKLAPIPIAYAQKHPRRAIERAGDSARTTHGAPQAIDATRAFAAILHTALNGADRATALRAADELDLHATVREVIGGSYREKHPPQIKGSGYIVDALEAALWAVAHHDTYEATVLAAANLGDDADTTAAIAGQLAGALQGHEAIPQRWRAILHRHDDLVRLADDLHDLQPDTPPAPDCTRDELQRFAASFDGYAHFGEAWGERHQAIMAAYRDHGTLPDDPDDVRAALFVAVRGLRFNGADTTLVEVEPGHFQVQDDPDYETGEYFLYQRALVEQLRKLDT